VETHWQLSNHQEENKPLVEQQHADPLPLAWPAAMPLESQLALSLMALSAPALQRAVKSPALGLQARVLAEWLANRAQARPAAVKKHCHSKMMTQEAIAMHVPSAPSNFNLAGACAQI